MAIADYSEPLTQLLSQGECSSGGISSWIDYSTLGITSIDIPNLIAMAIDDDLYEQDSEAAEGWAPIHAWRALGQLQAAAAVVPLLQKSVEFSDHDGWWEWMMSELPAVFGMIGAPAIPALAEFLQDRTKSAWSRVIAVDSLETIAKAQPDEESAVRSQCVAILMEALTQFEVNDPELNGFLVGVLVELKVMAAVPLIEQAFAAGKVDELFNGDWDEVQVSLGLKSRDEVPKMRYDRSRLPSESDFFRSPSLGSDLADDQGQKAKKKAKRKQQTDSRRKNRKKK